MWFKKENELYPKYYVFKKETFKEKIKYIKNKIFSNIKHFNSISSLLMLFIQKFHFWYQLTLNLKYSILLVHSDKNGKC